MPTEGGGDESVHNVVLRRTLLVAPDHRSFGKIHEFAPRANLALAPPGAGKFELIDAMLAAGVSVAITLALVQASAKLDVEDARGATALEVPFAAAHYDDHDRTVD